MKDRTGYTVFSEGPMGIAHAMAHEFLDAHSFRAGHRQLGNFLAANSVSGSEGCHLEWHQAVFELELGMVEAALDRYYRAVAPAVALGLAATDGPSLLWRLQEAGAPVSWDGALAQARSLIGAEDPYTRLHVILAMAGGGDLQGIRACAGQWESNELLLRAARGFEQLVLGDLSRARRELSVLAERINELGGSYGQNLLFQHIAA
jgi:hypothetical protein